MSPLLFSIAASIISAGAGENGGEPITDTLSSVTVIADKGFAASRKDIIILDQSDLISGSISRIPSLSLVDYGSAAGTKSVSLRGLGSAATSIYIDGLRVSNVQTGQWDLGLSDLSTFSSMTVDYVQNSVSFTTAAPTFEAGKRVNARALFSAGSFGTLQPSASVGFDLGRNWLAKADVSWFETKGDFDYADGLRRENNDLAQLRGGVDIFKNLKSGKLHIKTWMNSSERGTPGSTSYPDAESRQKDLNTFVQAGFSNRFSELYELNLAAKLSADDLDYSYSYGDYSYNQKGFQMNSSHLFHLSSFLKASAAASWSLDALDSMYNGEDYYLARRNSIQGAATLSLRLKRFEANIAALYNGYFDGGKAAQGAQTTKRDCLSPSFDFRLKAADGLHFTGFARRALRVPTFNDLYYPGSGNTALKAEDAVMTDLGAEYSKTFCSWKVSAKADFFHYSLKDKIVFSPDPSDPTGFTWLPYNIGKVRDNGADFSLGAEKTAGKLRLSLSARYSLQDATDRTEDSGTFGEQIPYISKNSFSASASARLQGFSLLADWFLRGSRSDSYGPQDGWSSLDLMLRKDFRMRRCNAGIFIKATNILDRRYEIIRYYPVPGRSVTAGISIGI